MIDRNVVTQKDIDRGRAPGDADNARERLLKFVPIETIGAYTAIEAGMKTYQDGGKKVSNITIWIVVAFLLVFTAVYLNRVWNVRRGSQLGVSMGAFLVYALTIGGLFATQVVKIDPLLQLILLVFAGLVLLFFKPPEPLPPPPPPPPPQ